MPFCFVLGNTGKINNQRQENDLENVQVRVVYFVFLQLQNSKTVGISIVGEKHDEIQEFSWRRWRQILWCFISWMDQGC